MIHSNFSAYWVYFIAFLKPFLKTIIKFHIFNLKFNIPKSNCSYISWSLTKYFILNACGKKYSTNDIIDTCKEYKYALNVNTCGHSSGLMNIFWTLQSQFAEVQCKYFECISKIQINFLIIYTLHICRWKADQQISRCIIKLITMAECAAFCSKIY